MNTKRCTKCGEEKDITDFHHDKQTADGFAVWCRACRNDAKYDTCHICGNRKAKVSNLCRECCDNEKRKRIKSNFWALVDIDDVDSCWLWTGSLTAAGYGRYAIKHGTRDMAHRIAYQYTYGAIPQGMFVCHNCDNPQCCNPNHLFIGTNRDNIMDMTRKERGNTVKLTAIQVVKIRTAYNSGLMTGVQLAQEYKVHSSTIYALIRRATWKHVP